MVIANVPVAQWIARRTSNPEAVGSSPTRDDIFNFFSIGIVYILLVNHVNKIIKIF